MSAPMLAGVEVEEMTLDDGRAMLGAQVGDVLGIPLDVFFERLDAGAYDDTVDDNVLRLVMLAPFGR